MSLSVMWIKNSNNTKKNITNAVISVTWSGSVQQTSRIAEITVPNAPNDKNVVRMGLNITNGDYIVMYENGDMFFYGQATAIEKKGASDDQLTYQCKDMLDHLIRSTTSHIFKNKTAEYVARKMCNIFGIKVGSINKTNVSLKKLIFEDTDIYSIIMKAYTKASKLTGKKYIIRMDGLKLCIYEKGIIVKNFYFSENVNITGSSYTETIDDMVNRVYIFDEKNKKIGEVRNDKSIKKYGIYQQTYTKEKGINPEKAAKSLLVGKTKTISIDTIEPNMKCIAGNGVKVYDHETGLSGLFWIDNDTHTWESGNHTAQFDLTFKNMWDKQED